MARPSVLEDPRPVQFFAERVTHKKALDNLRAMNRQHRTSLTLTDFLRSCLDDLAEGRIRLAPPPEPAQATPPAAPVADA